MLMDGRTLRREWRAKEIGRSGQTSQNRSISVKFEMMEIYWASEEPSILLIHHASEAARGLWRMAAPMRARASSAGFAMGQPRADFPAQGCGLDGLILTRRPVAIRQKGAVSIN